MNERRGKALSAAFFSGFVTGERSIDVFARRLQDKGRIEPDPIVVTIDKQRKEPDFASEIIGSVESGFFHSLGEMAIREKWPERIVFIINPPTDKKPSELMSGGFSVLKNVVRGAIKGTEDDRYRNLLIDGAKETFGHPVTTVVMGLKGVRYNSIERLEDYYSSLSRSERPDVHVVVSDREAMFEYDNVFEEEVVKAGFELHRVDCGHNSLYTKPERVLAKIVRELDQL